MRQGLIGRDCKMGKEIAIDLYLLYISGSAGWFVSREFGALFELDLQTGKCSPLTNVSQCHGISGPYSVRYKKDEYLYLFPEKRGSIFIYNMDIMRFHELKIPDADNYNIAVSEVHIIEDRLYAVCSGLGRIVVLDQDSIWSSYDVQEDISGYSVSIGNKIFCTSYKKNVLVEFDSQNGLRKCYDLPEPMMNIVSHGTELWLSGYKPYIYIWDYISHEVLEKIEIPQIALPDIQNERWPIFQKIVSSETYVWCIPLSTNYFVYINKKEKRAKVLEVIVPKSVSSSGAWFRFISVIDNRYLLVSFIKQAKVFQIDMEQAVVSERIITAREDECQEILDERFRKEVVREFHSGGSFSDYISYIEKSAGCHKEQGVYRNYGKEIYDALSGEEYH